MLLRTRKHMAAGFVAALALAAVGPVGCNTMGTKDGGDMTSRLEDAPPIKLGTMDGRHLLVMQAPNPGWSFSIDRAEQSRGGKRVFVTVRKPDPAYMYAQVIVEKRLLTDVDAETDLTVMARVLAHDADPDDGYAILKPVESFEQ